MRGRPGPIASLLARHTAVSDESGVSHHGEHVADVCQETEMTINNQVSDADTPRRHHQPLSFLHVIPQGLACVI